MEKLFDFVPSDVKADGHFFKDEQCQIIRALGGKGFFVITDEQAKGVPRYMPQHFCRMWWIRKAFPTNTRLGAVRAAREYILGELYGEGTATIFANGEPVEQHERSIFTKFQWSKRKQTNT